MNPKSLAERRSDWVKVVKVWNRIVKYVMDPANKDEVVKIMGARAGVPPEEYATYLPGTKLPDARGSLARFEQKDTPRVALRERQGGRCFQRGQQGLRDRAAGGRVHRRLALERGPQVKIEAKRGAGALQGS